jgi:hypothetical protein
MEFPKSLWHSPQCLAAFATEHGMPGIIALPSPDDKENHVQAYAP